MQPKRASELRCSTNDTTVESVDARIARVMVLLPNGHVLLQGLPQLSISQRPVVHNAFINSSPAAFVLWGENPIRFGTSCYREVADAEVQCLPQRLRLPLSRSGRL